MLKTIHQLSSKNLVRLISFLRNPHIPFFLANSLKAKAPRLHRALKYRTLDPTSKKYWDGIWKEEGLSTWRTYPNLFEKISEEIRPNARVLDIGCGPGVLLNKLRAKSKCECFGVDISSEAIKILKKANISGAVTRLPHIPFKDSAFDTVIATEVLEHLSNPLETMIQMKRVVKPGGLLICSVPNECLSKEENDEHLHNFTSESFTDLVRVLGDFKIFSINDKGGAKFLAIIKVPADGIPKGTPAG